jgi:arabinogalactan endo-1,4-beta-galactosidase
MLISQYFKFFILSILLSLLFAGVLFGQTEDPFIKGVDISTLPQIEDLGGIYMEGGIQKDLLDILKDNGINYIRLKLWHTPVQNYNNLAKILEMAQRIKEKGLKFLLDFHFSDTWADPGSQTKPAAWQGLSFNSLTDSVYNYTQRVISALDNQNTLPDMVQIGNETNSGMLWNDGRVGGGFDTEMQWNQLGALVNVAINGVRDGSANGDSVKIMIHRAGAADYNGNVWFFDNLLDEGVDFDVIGLSFYPWWHGTLTAMQTTINNLANRYDKEIIIAETAYPWTLDWYDSNNNIVGTSGQLHQGYPASVSGQRKFIFDLIQIVRSIPDNMGSGIFYWEAAFISVEPIGSPWENVTLFDFDGNVQESIYAFTDLPDTTSPINVKMIINTSTNWDTVSENHFVQLRGDLVGLNIGDLPDGKNLAWDSSSDLILTNSGGDYWQVDFQMVPGSELSYKIWTGTDQNNGTFRRLGMEGGINAYNGATPNTRNFIAGLNDTVLVLQYYSPSAEVKDQYWRPFIQYEDSIALYFRVNMGNAISSGRFNPVLNGPVGVRGDSLFSAGLLNWNNSHLLLREENSINDGSFWSGTVYFPKNQISPGNTLTYKFFIENDSDIGWENNVADRELRFTSSLISAGDTTIHWAYFDNNSISNIDANNSKTAHDIHLLKNYPNPFNPFTIIEYQVNRKTSVNIEVANSLGKIIRQIENNERSPGKYTVEWDGKNEKGEPQSSGIYFIRLRTNITTKTIKALLIK